MPQLQHILIAVLNLYCCFMVFKLVQTSRALFAAFEFGRSKAERRNLEKEIESIKHCFRCGKWQYLLVVARLWMRGFQ